MQKLWARGNTKRPNSPVGSKARRWTCGQLESRQFPAPGISNWQIARLGSSLVIVPCMSGPNNAGSCWKIDLSTEREGNGKVEADNVSRVLKASETKAERNEVNGDKGDWYAEKCLVCWVIFAACNEASTRSEDYWVQTKGGNKAMGDRCNQLRTSCNEKCATSSVLSDRPISSSTCKTKRPAKREPKNCLVQWKQTKAR
jgi:hypothetical protein